MGVGFATMIEPLVRRQISPSEEQAARTLVQDYVLRQITALKREVSRMEREYGMRFDQFGEYLHARSELLEGKTLAPDQQRTLSQAIMQEEDDWLTWKASHEMLANWLDILKAPVTSPHSPA